MQLCLARCLPSWTLRSLASIVQCSYDAQMSLTFPIKIDKKRWLVVRWATLVWRGGHFHRPGANPTHALASHDRCTSFPQASHLYCSQSTNLKTTITALNLTYKTLLWYSAAENSDSWDPNLELWAANDPSVAAARRFFWLEGSALWWALEQPEPENSSGNLRLGGRSCVTRQDTDTLGCLF